METWIFQGGYPVIEVDGGCLHQRRFTYSGGGDAQTWSVPVQLRTNSGDVHTVEVHEGKAELPVDASEVATYNHSGNGFFRVKVPFDQLVAYGANGVGSLAPVERFGLVDDTYTLALAGEVALSDYLTLLGGYRAETDVSVWQRITGSFGFIDHVAADGDRAALGGLVDALITDARERLGPAPQPGESARESQLRGALFSAAGTLSPAGSTTRTTAIAEARELLVADSPDAELRSAAVRIVASNGTPEDFAMFRSAFESASTPQDEVRNLYALPAFPGADQIDTVVEMALDGSIRTQNAPFVLAQALMSRDHGPAVWSRISQRWDEINEMFPSNTIVRMLTGVRWLTDAEAKVAVTAFFADREIPQGKKQLDQHLERLAVNAAFQERVRKDLRTALEG